MCIYGRIIIPDNPANYIVKDKEMIVNKLDSIKFRLKEWHDFTWLKKYGTAFWIVDETGSGCICIGMENGDILLLKAQKKNSMNCLSLKN